MSDRSITFLTGAGLSKNWGGFLAHELSAFLISSDELKDNYQVREKLMLTNDYEEVLGEYERYRDGNYDALMEAILSAFKAHDARITTPNPRLSLPKFCRFLDKINQENRPSPTYIFTLNQDLVLERHTQNCDSPIIFPGLHPQPKWLSDYSKEYDPDTDRITVSKTPDLHLEKNTTACVKLHGSFDWVQEDQSVLIAGREKEGRIKDFPILEAYWKLFEDYMTTRPIDLIVIGYSFRDPHVNKVLYKAAKNDLRLYIIDTTTSDVLCERWMSKVYENLGVLPGKVQSYCPVPLGDIFELHTSLADRSDWLNGILRRLDLSGY